MEREPFTRAVLEIDAGAEVRRLAAGLLDAVGRKLRRRGAVVAISGGIDSSVCAALAARALGPAKVLCLILPERESSPASAERARLVAARLGVETVTQDLTAALEAVGCYRLRDEAVRRVFPEYGPGFRMKLVSRGRLEGRFPGFYLVVAGPGGGEVERRLPHAEYLEVVAAQSYKQRLRKAVEYFHADRLNYAVVGTANRLEHDQGFFVKNGDGAADVKPIAHLLKTEVYALGRELALPEAVLGARPTTDTYTLPQSQDEFFFGLPLADMDLALHARDHGIPAGELARALGVDAARAAAIYADIDAKRATTRSLHWAGLTLPRPGDRGHAPRSEVEVEVEEGGP